jgi:hypothetical protein
MAVSKVGASARSRLDVRFRRREADRGLKDINTLVALIRGGWLSYAELEKNVLAMDYEPALIAESGWVLATIRQMVAS